MKGRSKVYGDQGGQVDQGRKATKEKEAMVEG